MKKIIFIKLLFCSLIINAQGIKNEIISKYDNGDFGSNEFFLNSFEGINKVEYSFVNNEKLIGKDFKIVIRKYKKGKLEFETILIDTKTEKMPKIKNEFNFSVFSKQTKGQQKIMFTFPTMGFFNRKIFNIDKSFEDSTFDYRDLVSISDNGKKTFEFEKEIQIGLITPPNNNPENGILGYCEVTKNEIDVKSWYNQYKILEFFLIYLVIE